MNDSEALPCLACSSPAVQQFLDLGETALANKFLAADELDAPEPRFPLRVGFCRACEHVQLMDRVPPHAMFSDYLYVSAASDTLRTHFEDLSSLLVQRHALSADDLVVDIGCNDGSLLKAFRSNGVRTLGVDPAENLAERARDLGIDRYTGFFGLETSREIVEKWGHAQLATATNTFPHIHDLPDFMAGIEHLLAPRGTFVVEAHYLVDILEQVAFDTIYHEHVSYWALGPMLRMLEQTHMQVTNAERLPIHHGQLRVTMTRRDLSLGEHANAPPSPNVAALIAAERDGGLGDFETYERFAESARRIKSDLRGMLQDLHSEGKSVAAYGAPAKGSTLLEFLGLGPSDIDWIADRSELKQGRLTPGSHIPVVPPERLLSDRPDFVLVLAWNFLDEVASQQAEYLRSGGKFIVPVPEVRIV